MAPYLLAFLIALGGDSQQTQAGEAGHAGGRSTGTMASLDGQWHVVCAERDGQKLNVDTVTIHGNTLSFSRDGQQHSMHLNFGPGHMLFASMGGDNRHGGSGAGSTPGASGTRGQSGTEGAGAGGQERSGGTAAGNTGGATTGQTGTAGGAAGTAPGRFGRGAMGNMHTGVYVLAGDYLCIGFDAAGAGRGGPIYGSFGGPGGRQGTGPGAGGPGAAGTPGGAGTSGGPGGTNAPGAAAGAGLGQSGAGAGTGVPRNQIHQGGVNAAGHTGAFGGGAHAQPTHFALVLHREGGREGGR